MKSNFYESGGGNYSPDTTKRGFAITSIIKDEKAKLVTDFVKFVDKLAPILTEVYEESVSMGGLPNTYNEALISLIGKKR